eukprot:TRINITY_DN7383_c0_g1_i2.p2 TRINITY_DN7383_c0_g1~~TRINITY_DN7383_c0_g1_i2.p2  ORF type:complete len:107 (-),score=29.69 TRINITY_DN7383_c0_g1_i2:71-391(-)
MTGVRAMERNHHGRDVDAACGQLALQSGANGEASTDIEDLASGVIRKPAQQAPKVGQKRGKLSKKLSVSEKAEPKQEWCNLKLLPIGVLALALVVYFVLHMKLIEL